MGQCRIDPKSDRIIALLPRWFRFAYGSWNVFAPLGITIWSIVHVLRAPSIWAGLTDPILWIANGVIWAMSVCLLFGTVGYLMKFKEVHSTTAHDN